jgi:hypothetical protein
MKRRIGTTEDRTAIGALTAIVDTISIATGAKTGRDAKTGRIADSSAAAVTVKTIMEVEKTTDPVKTWAVVTKDTVEGSRIEALRIEDTRIEGLTTDATIVVSKGTTAAAAIGNSIADTKAIMETVVSIAVSKAIMETEVFRAAVDLRAAMKALAARGVKRAAVASRIGARVAA